MSSSGGYGNNSSSYNNSSYNSGGYNGSSQSGGYNNSSYNSGGGYNTGSSSGVGNTPTGERRGLQPTTNDKYKVSVSSEAYFGNSQPTNRYVARTDTILNGVASMTGVKQSSVTRVKMNNSSLYFF